MPYYKNINLLFIHIPKTGGSSLELYLRTKCEETLLSGRVNNILPNELQYISLQHQKYTTIYKYRELLGVDFDSGLKVITIVRNPYDRIVSDLFWYGLININTSADEVYRVIQGYLYQDCYDNHNIPQYEFIIDDNQKLIQNIHIFRTESLTQQLHEYGYIDYIGKDNLGSSVALDHNVGIVPSNLYSNYLNNDAIKLINEFYHRDFELFEYQKIFVD